MRFKGLAKRNFLEMIRDPLTSLLGILFPSILLIMFVLINRAATEKLPIFEVGAILPGIIVLGFCLDMILIANFICKDKDDSLMARFQTLPLRPVDFVLAYSVPFLAFSLIQIVFTFLIGFVVGLQATVGILVAIPLLWFFSLFFIALGIILGTSGSTNLVLSLGNVLVFVITFLSGTWMDLNWLGDFGKFARALPFANAVEAGRELIAWNGFNFNHLYFIFGYTLLIVGVCILVFVLMLKRKAISRGKNKTKKEQN